MLWSIPCGRKHNHNPLPAPKKNAVLFIAHHKQSGAHFTQSLSKETQNYSAFKFSLLPLLSTCLFLFMKSNTCLQLSSFISCITPLEFWGSNNLLLFHSVPFCSSWQYLCWYKIIKNFVSLLCMSQGFTPLGKRLVYRSLVGNTISDFAFAEMIRNNDFKLSLCFWIWLRGSVNHSLLKAFCMTEFSDLLIFLRY